MDALQMAVNFGDIWLDLEKTIYTLVVGGSVSRAVWNDRVLDVHHLCLKPRLRLGEKVYQEIRTFLGAYLSQIQEVVYNCGPDNIPTEYEKYWLPFKTCVSYLDHLFSSLNTQVIRKHKFSRLNAPYLLYDIDCDDDMMEIGELALDMWRQIMVELQQEKLTASLISEVTKDRCGHLVNYRAVRCVIFSLIDLLKYKQDLDDFKLYEEVYEVPFFKLSTEYYIQKSQAFRDTYECSEFMKKVLMFIRDEELRSHKFLHHDSYNRIQFDCRRHLFIYDIPFLNQNCRDMIQREKWEDLLNMYKLLCPRNSSLENSLDTLIAEFEEHVQEIGLAVMQSLQGDNLASQFAEAMLEYLSKYTDQIRNVFEGNSRFLAALDRACTTAINFKRYPKASCRSPELLANYCDDLLKKGAKGLTENELDERLNQVIQLFNYISDKDMFQKFYSRAMAKRLIFGHFQSMDLEEAMINRLKQVCGYEYTSKLHRMFTDMAVSSDLNAKFTSFLNAVDDRHLNHGAFINVLAVGCWPISQTELPTFSLPQELEKCVRMFEIFYNEQFCGRKLTWMYNLSLVELKFCYCKKPYLVTMEMYLMGVLLCFNGSDTMNYRDIREHCQLPNKELLKQLQLLVDAKILLSEGTITDNSSFKLNLKYSNKRTKFKLLPVIQAEVVQEVVQTHMSVEEDRRMFIQASVVRIMKARKELSHTALIEEVINQARTRFQPKISTIKKCIEMLLEKQYIERSQKTQGGYIYVA